MLKLIMGDSQAQGAGSVTATRPITEEDNKS